MLEAMQYKDNAFITLSYSDENLPEDGSVDSITLQKGIKRLRKAFEPIKWRYYGVGEYGEETNRPHYHLAAFGLPTCIRGRTYILREGGECCAVCSTVYRAWGLGNIFVGQLEEASAAYIAGYVTKKWSTECLGKEDQRPPFARMSNRPGIGCGAMDEVASSLLQERYADDVDVPSVLRVNGRIRPIGRYLRRQLRLRMGRNAQAPLSTLEGLKYEMSELHQAAYSYAPVGSKRFAFKQEVIRTGEGKRARLEWRERNFKRKGSQ